MERTLSHELGAHVGERVRLQGWLHHQRQLAQVAFLLLRDRGGIAQIVLVDPDLRHRVADLAAESVIEVVGQVAASDQAPAGVEVVDPSVAVIAGVDAAPPFELRRPHLNAQLPTQLDHAALALRHPPRRAIAEIASASALGFRTALDGLGFTEIFTPKVVASATESGANVFPIEWFGSSAYLAQSPQFYKQMMVGVFERVYEIAPVFRAEPHDTARHLSEYVSLETATGRPTVGEPDLAPSDERWLCEWALAGHDSELLFVTGYPMAKRPFYTHPHADDPATSNSFDLLFRGLELVTGGQRLHRIEDYETALAGQDVEALAGFLEAFRHGMPPHGGFAIGLERWVARLAGAANIREVTLFPRDLNRLTP